MSFASGWVFGGLALLVPLVLLHLRQRGETVREVPSLLLWEELKLDDASGARGLRWPSLPLLLLLQALALTLLILALAQPRRTASSAKPTQVIVLDDSWRMQAAGAIADARHDIEDVIGADPSDTQVRIVLASGVPHVLYRGAPSGARAALARVRASAAPASLPTALTIAAGLLAGARDSVVLIRAAEDPMPTVSARAGELRTFTLAARAGEQGIFDAGARCGIGATSACEVYATVRNTSSRAVVDRISAQAKGHSPLTLQVRVAGDSSAPLALASEPGQQVSLRLQKSDPLRADDEAWVAVPAAGDLPSSSVVTLVGAPSVALATAQAFAAVPGVALHLRTQKTFARSEAAQSNLLVLDHYLPAGALPSSPAVLLVDPPRVPEGHVGGVLAETAVSGTDAGSELLGGVELSSLSIDPRAASRLALPRWLAPIVWSPAGVLLAAGDDGSQRIAALSFEPGRSDLPQLAALPILAANLVRWAAGWAPARASAGVPFAVDATAGVRSLTLARGGQVLERVSIAHAGVAHGPLALQASSPGPYTIRETGPGLTREARLAVNTAAAPTLAAAAVDLSATRVTEAGAPESEAAWFLAAALLVLMLEWAYWISRRRRAAL